MVRDNTVYLTEARILLKLVKKTISSELEKSGDKFMDLYLNHYLEKIEIKRAYDI